MQILTQLSSRNILFLALTGAQEVTICVRPSVRLFVTNAFLSLFFSQSSLSSLSHERYCGFLRAHFVKPLEPKILRLADFFLEHYFVSDQQQPGSDHQRGVSAVRGWPGWGSGDRRGIWFKVRPKENWKEGETIAELTKTPSFFFLVLVYALYKRICVWHWKDMELLCMHEASFLLPTQLTRAKTAVEWIHHFLCLLLLFKNGKVCVKASFSPLLILLVKADYSGQIWN